MAVSLTRCQAEAVERLLTDCGLGAGERSGQPEPEAVCCGWRSRENSGQNSG